MSPTNKALYSDDYLAYQRDRNWFRKWLRQFYIRHAVNHLIPPVIDFGCGIGEHLIQLGADSIGIEVNQSSVDFCVNKGLNVIHYNPEVDQYNLSFLKQGQYKSLLISHVLEHLDNPDQVFRTLLESCERIGVVRVFVCVPGKKGYAHDATHMTFINSDYIYDKKLHETASFKISKIGYYPFNMMRVGNYFTHNEMFIIYNLINNK